MHDDVRDQVVDFVTKWSKKSEIPKGQFLIWLDISGSKFYDWQQRYGRPNQHNGKVPRRFWLEEWERRAIINFAQAHPDEGYRRLTYMMIDADEVATSPSTVY